ncbi:N-acetylmuramoyl-L-alanine amidase [Flectobacillus sp. DC10W]|uniref:N-acetylmuramoyl-L-alanine amidase n=1 Tax=Flectobacillus longus TaxID=2984207 RepID=A0ABT6YIA6_9BACT|nr:N-acetylmuramoyl-L-alanine amidase [Flectobacillus longus]MDI9863330.1 N-acetylmuramoyl-L-alanine amidase [Flectobacillus longus]
MKATSIPDHERTFALNGIDSSGKKFNFQDLNLQIGNTNQSIDFKVCNLEGSVGDFYYREETNKRKIVLHYTMGFLKGDIATLTGADHVSVPFVVARNGTIYNLFPSKYWSYHLGPGASGGNTQMSKESIGIEISNIGPLVLNGNNLTSVYSNSDIYCSLNEKQFYVAQNPSVKKYGYYASFTNAQYISVIKLVKFLIAKYNIPEVVVNDPAGLMNDNDFATFSGIVTHTNCRKDKTDIGPAFDWQRFEDGLTNF